MHIDSRVAPVRARSLALPRPTISAAPWWLALLALLAALAATTAPVAAQTVRLANLAAVPFEGWKRVTVDTLPPHASGQVGDVRYVVGRKVGLDVWVVDVHATLLPHQRRTINLAASVAAPVPAVGPPANPIAYFGGVLTLNGAPIPMGQPRVDGAALTMQGRLRHSSMLCTEVWLRWYPDQPGLVFGEALVTASNGAVPDLGAQVGAGGLRLAFGSGLVHVIGAGWGAPIVAGQTSFADGQGRAVPFVVLWPQHFATPAHWLQAAAAIQFTLGGAGIQRLWPHGNPTYPASFDPIAWTAARFPEAVRRLHTWEPGVTGPAANSGVTGGQDDQVFVGGEYSTPLGIGAEAVTYLSALKLAARPCHHLESLGRQADPVDHPQCVFWGGRPHWHLGVSPDQLGKNGPIDIAATHGWMGPDREHWLYNTVAAAARITGSPLLQRELEQQARIFLFSETVTPGVSTSTPDAARSIGWAGLLVTHLWRNLEDRTLAQRVAQRWTDRVYQVYLPTLWNRPHDVWDVRIDDARLGPGAWWMAWQQSIGSYGLDLACELLDIPAGRLLALKGARACIAHNWILQGNRYRGAVNIPFPPPPASYYNGHVFDVPWFETTWDVPALAVVLRLEPTHAKANAVWQQVQADLAGQLRPWVPPGF